MKEQFIVAIDGAVKAPGTAECLSVGCAGFFSISTDLFKVRCEHRGSTSQRGEINGLILALEEAIKYVDSIEDVIIITDSEYIYNTITYEWVKKWAAANWTSASGEPPKNRDQWEHVLNMLNELESKDVSVYMSWTKGHLFRYPPSKVKMSMNIDQSGSELLSSISTMLNVSTAKDNAIKAFNAARSIHDMSVLVDNIATEHIVYNTFVDAVAVYTANILKAVTDTKSDNNK